MFGGSFRVQLSRLEVPEWLAQGEPRGLRTPGGSQMRLRAKPQTKQALHSDASVTAGGGVRDHDVEGREAMTRPSRSELSL